MGTAYSEGRKERAIVEAFTAPLLENSGSAGGGSGSTLRVEIRGISAMKEALARFGSSMDDMADALAYTAQVIAEQAAELEKLAFVEKRAEYMARVEMLRVANGGKKQTLPRHWDRPPQFDRARVDPRQYLEAAARARRNK